MSTYPSPSGALLDFLPPFCPRNSLPCEASVSLAASADNKERPQLTTPLPPSDHASHSSKILTSVLSASGAELISKSGDRDRPRMKNDRHRCAALAGPSVSSRCRSMSARDKRTVLNHNSWPSCAFLRYHQEAVRFSCRRASSAVARSRRSVIAHDQSCQTLGTVRRHRCTFLRLRSTRPTAHDASTKARRPRHGLPAPTCKASIRLDGTGWWEI